MPSKFCPNPYRPPNTRQRPNLPAAKAINNRQFDTGENRLQTSREVRERISVPLLFFQMIFPRLVRFEIFEFFGKFFQNSRTQIMQTIFVVHHRVQRLQMFSQFFRDGDELSVGKFDKIFSCFRLKVRSIPASKESNFR